MAVSMRMLQHYLPKLTITVYAVCARVGTRSFLVTQCLSDTKDLVTASTGAGWPTRPSQDRVPCRGHRAWLAHTPWVLLEKLADGNGWHPVGTNSCNSPFFWAPELGDPRASSDGAPAQQPHPPWLATCPGWAAPAVCCRLGGPVGLRAPGGWERGAVLVLCSYKSHVTEWLHAAHSCGQRTQGRQRWCVCHLYILFTHRRPQEASAYAQPS